MIKGLFVTGTDTGVGKTLVASSLIRILREHHIDAVGFKPVATGEQDGHWHDVDALSAASGGSEPDEHICPMRFSAPMAPVQAAHLEGIEPNISLAERALADLDKKHALVVAEGTGGLMVPLTRNVLVLDFIKKTGFNVVLVASAKLGTVNHTLLSLGALERAGIPVSFLVMNIHRPEDAKNAKPSIEEIERHSKHTFDATIPYCGDTGDLEAPITEIVARGVASLSSQIKVHALIKDLA